MGMYTKCFCRILESYIICSSLVQLASCVWLISVDSDDHRYKCSEPRSLCCNKVMKIVKYGIPMVYAACYGWMGAYKVSTLSQTSHNDANCYQPTSPATTNPDENASSSV